MGYCWQDNSWPAGVVAIFTPSYQEEIFPRLVFWGFSWAWFDFAYARYQFSLEDFSALFGGALT